MDADGTLVEFGTVHDFVDGFHGIDESGMASVQLVDISRSDGAVAGGGIDFLYSIIANVQVADGRRHPAVLIAMVVDAAVLADFPTEGHAFEQGILEDEIAGVIPFGEKDVLFKAFGADGMVDDVILDGLEAEIVFRDGGETGDPVGDIDLLSDGDVLGHKDLRKRIAGFEEIIAHGE